MSRLSEAELETEVKYGSAAPLRTHLCRAWLVTFASGRRLLELWAVDTSIEDIHSHYRVIHPDERFTIGPIDIGVLEISKTISSYASDGRKVNQDWEIVL